MEQEPKLLTRLRNKIRTLVYSWHTEKTYVDWVRDYINFHHKQHPSARGLKDVNLHFNKLVDMRHAAPLDLRHYGYGHEAIHAFQPAPFWLPVQVFTPLSHFHTVPG